MRKSDDFNFTEMSDSRIKKFHTFQFQKTFNLEDDYYEDPSNIVQAEICEGEIIVQAGEIKEVKNGVATYEIVIYRRFEYDNNKTPFIGEFTHAMNFMTKLMEDPAYFSEWAQKMSCAPDHLIVLSKDLGEIKKGIDSEKLAVALITEGGKSIADAHKFQEELNYAIALERGKES